jgi:hypothetical protein
LVLYEVSRNNEDGIFTPLYISEVDQ